MEEENKNIEDENCYPGNTESVATDRNENLSQCERTSGGAEEPYEDKGEVRLLEQMPSTESESSGCSKTVPVPMDDSLIGQESQGVVVHSGAGAHGSAGEPVKGETEKSGGITSPDSPSSIYQVRYHLLLS